MAKFSTIRGKAPSIHISHFGQDVEKDYNEINFLETPDRKIAKMEYGLARHIGDHLAKCYPKREWAVYVDLPGGIIRIGCDSLSWTRGHVIHLGDKSPSDLKRAAAMAAGEILERFNISRSKKFDEAELDAIARDIRDEAVSPDAVPDKHLRMA